ncbi:MAG: class II aldolase/adducin family protein [Dehalococcoidia bacterium]
MKWHETLIRCGRVMVEEGLTWGRSGNISLVTGENRFLITGGGAELGSLQEDDLIRCEIDSDGFDGSRPPSMETQLHRNIYRACVNAKAVIHSQPVYSTIFACSDLEIRSDFLPEAMAYLERVERVPYFHAGSQDLAEATAGKASLSRVLLLNNHGVVCRGESLDEALLLTRTLEFCCRLIITSRGGGIEFNYLGDKLMDEFRAHLRDIGR